MIDNLYFDSVQSNITDTLRNLAQARACIAKGDYAVAQMILFTAAQNLTGAAQWQFAACGTNNKLTPGDMAQIYKNAIQKAQDNAATYNNLNPEHVQTVADLRAELKSGSDNAAQLVNDLISDNPNQATAWVTRDDIYRHADDMTDEQRAALMEYIRTEYELIDTSAEITNAREMMDELDK